MRPKLPNAWMAAALLVCVPPAVRAAAQEEACSSRIIVTFSQDQGSPPNDRAVAGVARAARVRLELLRSIGHGLYLYALQAAGSDPDCSRALARLRRAPGVRSADIDRRRRVQR